MGWMIMPYEFLNINTADSSTYKVSGSALPIVVDPEQLSG